jgi:hypothetical protein
MNDAEQRMQPTGFINLLIAMENDEEFINV